MSGRDPIDIIATKPRTRATSSETRHIAKATALAKLFSRIGNDLEKGRVSRARSLSHRAHALLHVLSALDAQDKYPELRSPKCEEKRQAAQEWKLLFKPRKSTLEDVQEHYEQRAYSFIRVTPLPPAPEPAPKVAYRGGIYETVFATADPKAAQLAGLAPSYVFRHGVTMRGYHLSVYDAVRRRLPKLSKEQGVPVGANILTRRNRKTRSYEFCELHIRAFKATERLDFVYRVESTTYAEAAKELAGKRSGR